MLENNSANQVRALGLNRDRNSQWMLPYPRSVPSVMHFKTTETYPGEIAGDSWSPAWLQLA